MGALCACISQDDRKEDVEEVSLLKLMQFQAKDKDSLAILPLARKVQPLGDNQGSDIDKLLDSYTRDIQKFIPSEIEGNERALIIIFGAYVQKVREVVFKQAENDRQKALVEKDWKASRAAYKNVIAKMFSSV